MAFEYSKQNSNAHSIFQYSNIRLQPYSQNPDHRNVINTKATMLALLHSNKPSHKPEIPAGCPSFVNNVVSQAIYFRLYERFRFFFIFLRLKTQNWITND